MRLTTRHAANLGLLTAVSIVLTRMFGFVINVAGVSGLRISFGEIPIMLAGVLFGPAGGALTGLAADLVGYMLNPFGGPYFPGFTLSAALTGLIPGLILFKKRGSLRLWQIGAVVLLTDLITGVLLNTLWLTIIMKKGFFILLPMRALSRVVTVPVYAVAIFLIINRAYHSYRRGTKD